MSKGLVRPGCIFARTWPFRSVAAALPLPLPAPQIPTAYPPAIIDNCSPTIAARLILIIHGVCWSLLPAPPSPRSLSWGVICKSPSHSSASSASILCALCLSSLMRNLPWLLKPAIYPAACFHHTRVLLLTSAHTDPSNYRGSGRNLRFLMAPKTKSACFASLSSPQQRRLFRVAR
jgi:hypothetical protein